MPTIYDNIDNYLIQDLRATFAVSTHVDIGYRMGRDAGEARKDQA